MVNLLLDSAPVFLVFLVVEALSFRFLPDAGALGYERADTRTSVIMGVGDLAVNLVWNMVAVAAYVAVYLVSPIHLPVGNPLTWVALFFADDLAYYCFHRVHHVVRIGWASHSVHHSSERFNFSTGVRQTWTPFTTFPFWLPLALLFPPWMILLEQSLSLVYQFFVHTERVKKLWRPVEFVMNTPSHHRVHHGSNSEYLDKNYAGILIIWDRMFGTFEPERARVIYGLTHNINTYNPLKVAVHEYPLIWRDVRRASTWRERLGYVFFKPGWAPPAYAQ